jgi:hypothetical protein
MGESSQNEILILIEENQINENEMYIEEDGEIGESENFQTKNSKVEGNWGTINEEKIAKNYMFKENFGKGIVEMCNQSSFRNNSYTINMSKYSCFEA